MSLLFYLELFRIVKNTRIDIGITSDSSLCQARCNCWSKIGGAGMYVNSLYGHYKNHEFSFAIFSVVYISSFAGFIIYIHSSSQVLKVENKCKASRYTHPPPPKLKV